MYGTKQLFPIESETACLLKWNWSTIYFQSGTTSSCHRTTKLKIPENNFSSFHNLPTKVEDRQQMLKGHWPKNTCDYCKKIEDQGQYSDRMNQLHQQTDISLTPPELIKDASSTSVTPTFIEVYFRNTCNMSCVYCGPHFSSKWEEELKKHGDLPEFEEKQENTEYSVKAIQHNPLYKKQKNDFWAYLEENERYKILRWFSFLGGEPLVIPELDECMNFWDKHPNENLTFQMITNLKADETRFDSFLNKIEKLTSNKKIYQFKVIASLDCLGEQAEYVRYGLKMDQWYRNFEKLLKVKNLSVGINSALSILTLPTFSELLEKIQEWNEGRKLMDRIVHSFNLESGITNPTMAGSEFFEPFLKVCNKYFPAKTAREISIKKYWDGLINNILSSSKDSEKIIKLRNYLSRLDSRRNTNWQKTFPWLVNL
jgi:organic radical activating enzyme